MQWKQLGIAVDPKLAESPSRLGKGGPKKAIVPFTLPIEQPETSKIAETPSELAKKKPKKK